MGTTHINKTHTPKGLWVKLCLTNLTIVVKHNLTIVVKHKLTTFVKHKLTKFVKHKLTMFVKNLTIIVKHWLTIFRPQRPSCETLARHSILLACPV